MIDPCVYLNHSYDRNEFADFSQYCFEKYKNDFVGKTITYPWCSVSDREDSKKFKKILQNLFDIFESIGQPLVANNPKMFWSLPNAYGLIHKDPIGYKGKLLDEYSKWACNIPAVNSDEVFLEFFDNATDDDTNFKNHENIPQQYAMPNFYRKYTGQNLELGQRAEEQVDPVFKKSFTELGKDIAMEHIAYLAYEASRLAGIVIPGEFDTFLKRLTVCEFVLSDDELPTQAAIDTL